VKGLRRHTCRRSEVPMRWHRSERAMRRGVRVAAPDRHPGSVLPARADDVHVSWRMSFNSEEFMPNRAPIVLSRDDSWRKSGALRPCCGPCWHPYGPHPERHLRPRALRRFRATFEAWRWSPREPDWPGDNRYASPLPPLRGRDAIPDLVGRAFWGGVHGHVLTCRNPDTRKCRLLKGFAWPSGLGLISAGALKYSHRPKRIKLDDWPTRLRI